MLDGNVRRPSFKQGNQLEYEKLMKWRRLQSGHTIKVFIGALMLYQLLMMRLPMMPCITILFR